MKLGSLNVEEKRIWKPDTISISSSQENRLIKGVVQSWVMPVLAEKDIHRKILQSEIYGDVKEKSTPVLNMMVCGVDQDGKTVLRVITYHVNLSYFS